MELSSYLCLTRKSSNIQETQIIVIQSIGVTLKPNLKSQRAWRSRGNMHLQ